MTTEIQLTPAELEMINLRREQELLKQKEVELREQAQLEKDIAAAERKMQKTMTEDSSQVNATLTYFKDFPTNYEYSVREWEDKVQVSRYDSENRQSNVVWSKTFTRRCASFKKGEYWVRVAFHETYSKWGHSRGGEYKMYISGPGIDWNAERRAYTRYGTVIEKIKEAANAIDAKAKAEADKKDAVKTTLKKIADMYPTAIVVTGESGERNAYSKHHEWISYPIVTVTFDNGVVIKYRVCNNGSLARKDITFPNMKDTFSLMDAMSKLSFNTENS